MRDWVQNVKAGAEPRATQPQAPLASPQALPEAPAGRAAERTGAPEALSTALPGYGEVMAFALPLMVSLATSGVHSLIAALFVGRLGTAPLAALGVANMYYFGGAVLMIGLMRNSMAFLARAYGAREYSRLGEVLGQYQCVALAGWPILWMYMQVFPFAMRLAGLDEPVLQLAWQYLAIRIYELPLVLTIVLYATFYQATGNSWFPMLVNWGVVGLSVLLNYGLVLGRLGLPGLGIRGSALASLTSDALGVAFIVAVTHLGQQRQRYGLRVVAPPRWALLKRILAVSIPQGLGDAADVMAYLGFFMILAQYGDAPLAASNIGFQITQLLFLPGLALGIAAGSYVGRFLGRGAPRAARATTYRVVGLGMLYMGVLGAPLWFWGETLARAFTDDPAVIAQSGLVLKVMAVYQVCDAAGIILRVALGGAGDTRFPTVALAVIAVTVMFPGAWGLAKLVDPPLIGAWLGASLYMLVLALVLLYRFERGPWPTLRAVTGG